MISPYITLIKRITEGRPSESGLGDGHVIKAKESYTWSGTDTTRVIESIQFDGGYFDSGSGANYYVRDYLGNIIAVVDEWGHLVQATDYYPYGLPFRMPDIDEDNNATAETGDTGTGVTSNRYLFGGKEFLTEDGQNEYYQEARQYIPRIPRFDRIDDLQDEHHDQTPYLAFAGNPVMCYDPSGCDTVWVKYDDKTKTWAIQNTVKSKGADYIITEKDGACRKYEFSEGEYGNRVIGLCLEISKDYSINVLHVSGEKDGTFLAITPGGEASNVANTGKRIKFGNYPITTPTGREEWRRPGLGGEVLNRGIRFHYGANLSWTEGCFLVTYAYSKSGNTVTMNKNKSREAADKFDDFLGATEHYYYEFTNRRGERKKRYGSAFPKPINKLFISISALSTIAGSPGRSFLYISLRASSRMLVLFSTASPTVSSLSSVAESFTSSPNISRSSASDSIPSAWISTVTGILRFLSMRT